MLADFDDRLPWKKTSGALIATEILRGNDGTGLTVVLAEAPSEPSKADLQGLWRLRAGRSADPVLLLTTYPSEDGDRVAVLGPDGSSVPVSGLEVSMVERLTAEMLAMESPTGLVAELRRRLASLRGGVASGIRNEGLFASHVLSQQPQRADWRDLCSQSERLLSDRGQSLLTGLGYKVEHVPDGVVLRSGSDGQRRAAAVLLLDDESFDNPIGRFAGSKAVTHGLALARRENVPWLILLGGSVARLFPANPDVGVGRKGQTQTFVEIDLNYLTGDTAGYLGLLFAPNALASGGTVESLLADSERFATALSDRLRDRIYEEVIPSLATAVAVRSKVWDVPVEEQKTVLDEAYHQAMIILFRMLFVAYAEDRELLPLGQNDAYTANALNTLAKRMLDGPDKGFSETSTSLWGDLTQIWEVIDTGDLEGMGVPAYNGGLFTRDKKKNPAGAATYKLRLTNSEIGPVIRGLMIDITPDGYPGLVDFRSLDVREFGTIYEGLLESGLAIADTDLTVDNNDTFVPAKKGDEIIVEAGSVYFHSRSGSRKATGSYFTKPFAVQHLLDQALEPALDTHLNKIKSLLDKGANQTAAENLFDFRVADLSMGSAHFLVAAVDRIEARFSAFIAENPMPEVQDELHKLRATAATQLGLNPDESGIDDGILLRRQIARRCIYGIDLNEIAVELARLALWIHTFVPGLPLSFLNHGLIHGNSLTGVGTIQEITDSIREAQQREDRNHQADGMFDINQPLEELLARADTHLARLATLTGASINEIQQVQDLYQEVTDALEPLTALCDLITAERTTRKLKLTDPDKFLLIGGANNNLTNALTADELEQAILKHPQLKMARQVARQVKAIHLPTSFPEVFRREPSGFDCALGNPPWDKLHINVDSWWAQRFPGFNSLKPKEKQAFVEKQESDRPHLIEELESERQSVGEAARILEAGPFPGIGEAHLDLYAAFAWRIWGSVRKGGVLGIVVPRTTLSGASTAEWRRRVLKLGDSLRVTTLVNERHWVFDAVHPQYTIALLILGKSGQKAPLALEGPFSNLSDLIEGLRTDQCAAVPTDELLAWSTDAVIPLLRSDAYTPFIEMSKCYPFNETRVVGWQFRPVQGDLNQTTNKELLSFGNERSESKGSFNVLTGKSFNIWEPLASDPIALADRNTIDSYLVEKRRRQVALRSSAFFGLGSDWAEDLTVMPYASPRIAFRDVCRATDTRTCIPALIAPDNLLVESAPYLFRQQGTPRDEAYLLGVMSSLPFDWYARHYVELHLKFYMLANFPIPLIDPESGRPKRRLGQDPGDIDMRPLGDRTIEITGRLAAVDDHYSDWAGEVGVPVGSVKTLNEKDALIAELDALVSLLYGLSREQVEQVFATFHRGWDYKPRLTAVLAHFDAWSASLGEGK